MTDNQQNVSRVRGKLRAAADDMIRDEVRDPPRTTTAVKEGRTRKRKAHIDPYYIPKEIIPEGWTYEWKAAEVAGMPNTAHMVGMRENGWTEVPCERHEGLFMPPGHRGDIMRGGQVLMERPIELTQEARAEELAMARAQVEAQKQQLGLSMPDGFNTSHRGVQPRVNQSYERGMPQGRHTVAVD